MEKEKVFYRNLYNKNDAGWAFMVANILPILLSVFFILILNKFTKDID